MRQGHNSSLVCDVLVPKIPIVAIATTKNTAIVSVIGRMGTARSLDEH